MQTQQNVRYQVLWDSWQSLYELAKDAVELRTYEIFTKLKQAACTELERSAARFARLGTSDEIIFESLAKLMEVYQRVVELGSSIEHNDSAVHTLMAGICEVLGSRLKEFDDIENKGECQNPVTQEKCEIINLAISNMCMQLDNMARGFITTMQEERPDTWTGLYTSVLNSSIVVIDDTITNECLPKIYTHFEEALRLCLAELDDLHGRKVAGLYTELIKREWEELGNIIKVQVMALESAAAEIDEPQEVDELSNVQLILNVLREAYQYLGPVIDEVQKLLQSPPVRHTGPEYEEFANVIKSALCSNQPEEIPPPHLDSNFFALLAEETIPLFDQVQMEFVNTTEQMQAIVNNDKLLAEEILSVFANAQKSLPMFTIEDAQLQEGEDAQLQLNILKGIIETIEIKVESLHESIQSFKEDGLNLLGSFNDEKPIASHDEILGAQEAVQKAWLESPPELECVAEFFATILHGDIFVPFQDRVKKRIISYLEKADKLAFRFKKEVLLYEICTFEEILTHSASRLRESHWDDMAAAERELTAAYSNLETLLENNSIIAICPAAHEPFNAFEHEILVAESLEGFAKGEIIKIINTGYKQNGKVILRANVVAAR